jgi:hypothetical protein
VFGILRTSADGSTGSIPPSGVSHTERKNSIGVAVRTTISIAVHVLLFSLVKAFVESSVSVNTAAYTDETLVSAAVAFGCKETVRWLLENGANVNQVDNGGRNALWGVSDTETAQWIIDAGVDLRHLTDSGRDLFSSFLEEGRFEIAQLLVDRGVGDQATLDRAKPSGTPEQRGQAIVYEDATESERADIDARNAIDYGLVLPFRSINLRTGKIDY